MAKEGEMDGDGQDFAADHNGTDVDQELFQIKLSDDIHERWWPFLMHDVKFQSNNYVEYSCSMILMMLVMILMKTEKLL